MDYEKFISRECDRVEDLLSNAQKMSSGWRVTGSTEHIGFTIATIRGALGFFEMTMRAERDKIREDEEKENDEVELVRDMFFEETMDKAVVFRRKSKDTVSYEFADGWLKCKKHYGIS